MAAPSQRGKRPTDKAATRAVQLGIDGEIVEVFLTTRAEQRLRLRLAPYIAKARQVDGVEPVPWPVNDLAGELRGARLRSLLRLPASSGVGGQFSEEFQQLVERTAAIYARSLADSTATSYRRRWEHFAGWCQRHDQEPLPASAELVMTYLADLIGADPPPALGTLRGRMAAINKVHVESDLPAPGDDPLMALMMRGLSRTVAAPPRHDVISAMRIADLRDICRSLSHPNPLVVRDSALLRLWAAGLNAGQLSRLRWSDVTVHPDDIELALRSAWQRAPDAWNRLERQTDPRDCPVRALLQWRELGGTTPDQVFTAVERGGHRYPRMLSRYEVQRIVDTRLDSLGAQNAHAKPDAAAVARLLDTTPNDVLRDRAMLLLGWAGAFRRGEVTRLLWSDLRVVDEGLVVRLRQSKTDTYARGQDVGIPLGRSLMTCPVRAVLAWKQRMQEQLGADFDEKSTGCWPKIGRAGRITADQPISPEGLTMMIRRRAQAAGVDGHWGGRSLRAGFISTAADLELPLELVAAQSRHASLDNLLRYVRADDVFRRNAADRVGL